MSRNLQPPAYRVVWTDGVTRIVGRDDNQTFIVEEIGTDAMNAPIWKEHSRFGLDSHHFQVTERLLAQVVLDYEELLAESNECDAERAVLREATTEWGV